MLMMMLLLLPPPPAVAMPPSSWSRLFALAARRMLARDNCHQLESSPVRQQQLKAAAQISL
jgi:hypothetical protein